MSETEGTTLDAIFDGRVRIRQSRDGYRFSIDALLLAARAAERAGDTCVDLGTGCGVIALALAWRRPDLRVWGLEIQAELAALARENAAANAMADRVTILERDFRHVTLAEVRGPVSLVVSNPPYRKPVSGRLSGHPQRVVARHEIMATLADVVASARRLLGLGGRFLVVYPAERCAELLAALREAEVEPKWLRPVYGNPRSPEARLVVVEGVRGGGPGMKLAPPLFVYGSGGGYTDEVNRLLSPDSGVNDPGN